MTKTKREQLLGDMLMAYTHLCDTISVAGMEAALAVAEAEIRNDAAKECAELVRQHLHRHDIYAEIQARLRPMSDGSFDELFAEKPDSVHMEMLDDGMLWVRLESGDDAQVIWISAKKRGKLEIRTEKS